MNLKDCIKRTCSGVYSELHRVKIKLSDVCIKQRHVQTFPPGNSQSIQISLTFHSESEVRMFEDGKTWCVCVCEHNS